MLRLAPADKINVNYKPSDRTVQSNMTPWRWDPIDYTETSPTNY